MKEQYWHIPLSKGNPTYQHTDWQGSVNIVSDRNGKLAQHTGYYPYGEPWREPSGQPYLFGGKERLREAGLNEYDFAARRLNSALTLWTTPDPLASKFDNINPYTYCGGNPIKYVDPSGCALVVNGEYTDLLIKTLNMVLSTISLVINDNGEVSYKEKGGQNNEQSGYDAFIKKTIDDKRITVNILAQESGELGENALLIGGSFLGTQYDESSGTVTAFQALDPQFLNDLSLHYTGQVGQDIFHELTESYYAGEMSLEDKISSPAANVEGSIYNKAHAKAISQSGPVDCDGYIFWMFKPDKLYVKSENTRFCCVQLKTSSGKILKTLFRYVDVLQD